MGLPFDQAATAPKARLCTVALTPAAIDVNAEFCGILFDNWTEQLPGLTSVTTANSGYEAAEVTGVSFTVEAPDAYPPQSILLAIAPDQTAGWSLDILLDVVTETLELAKVRMVDLGDLIPAGPCFAGVAYQQQRGHHAFRSGGEVMSWRLEPSPRTTGIDEGLAAKVHDPLWLLGRQWQVGEFNGRDAGTPAVVQVAGNSAPVNAWRGAQQTEWTPFDGATVPLDALVEPEDEPALTLRERIEAARISAAC